MSWPEQPEQLSIEQWQRRVVRRGRALKRRRAAIVASSLGAALSLAVIVPLVIVPAANSAQDRLQIVQTPADKATASPRPHDRTSIALVPDPGPPGPSNTNTGSSSVGTALTAASATGGNMDSAAPEQTKASGASAVTVDFPPYKLSASAQCDPGELKSSTCPGSGGQQGRTPGELISHAYVQTGNNGTQVDSGSDDVVAKAHARVQLAEPQQSVTITVDYRLAKTPVYTGSPGNTAADAFLVQVAHTACDTCGNNNWISMFTTTPTTGSVTVTVTNSAGGDVPAGWLDVTISAESAAEIGPAGGSGGQPGSGHATATLDVVVGPVRLN